MPQIDMNLASLLSPLKSTPIKSIEGDAYLDSLKDTPKKKKKRKKKKKTIDFPD
jgi:hypothetical protein